VIDEKTIRTALAQLSEELARRDVMGELNLVGGTAMVLAFRSRAATKDVDAIFEPSAEIREAAAIVAAHLSLPTDWLNDAAKGFLSPAADFEPLPSMELANLRVQAPTPQYMLAMKVLAARSGIASERGDREDIAFLIRLLDLRRSEEVLEIVQRYYDPSRVLPRSHYLVDEILEELYRS
jgi:hypothetical protein